MLVDLSSFDNIIVIIYQDFLRLAHTGFILLTVPNDWIFNDLQIKFSTNQFTPYYTMGSAFWVFFLVFFFMFSLWGFISDKSNVLYDFKNPFICEVTYKPLLKADKYTSVYKFNDMFCWWCSGEYLIANNLWWNETLLRKKSCKFHGNSGFF